MHYPGCVHDGVGDPGNAVQFYAMSINEGTKILTKDYCTRVRCRNESAASYRLAYDTKLFVAAELLLKWELCRLTSAPICES
jgi:hypothetical protein